MKHVSKGSPRMHRFSTAVLGAVLTITAAVLTSGSSAAEARGRMLSPAERGIVADVLRTHGDVRDMGPMDARKPVRIGVLLKYRHEAELEALTIAQGDRRSPYYHKYLSIAQWDNYFAPDAGTYLDVERKLQRAGFRIEQTFRNRGMIRAIGSSGAAARYFRTQFHQVSQVRRGMRYINVTPAIMPAELASSVIAVAGLHSVVSMHFPLHFSKRGRQFARPPAPHRPRTVAEVIAAATASPKPITTSTPPANPSPDPTEVPNSPSDDSSNYSGFGPSIFADAYDFPVQHGYDGRGHISASVIDSDYSDVDANLEFKTFGIPRVQTATNAVRVCTDPNGACTICNPAKFSATCDNEGESSLDADTIMSLAPGAAFYEYLVNETDSLDDVDVDAAYERVVSDDLADAVNSSFGDCETDDPSALYSNNYIAMEGAAEGITFSASAGDTGGTSCGLYSGNGTPQTEINVSYPASAPYFTSVGGTTFDVGDLPMASCSLNDCYDDEVAWMDGGGGVSVYEPQPSWQTAFVAQGTTTQLPSITALLPAASSGRDVPDLAFVADPETGEAEAIAYDNEIEAVGGTSLSSPMWVAMQTAINGVQGSRNGFVNPRLYAIAAAEYSFPGTTGTTGPAYTAGNYTFAFRDITLNNNIPYEAGPGYDLTTGIGSALGWELAGTE